MNVLDDCFGNSVRLTAERLAHILEHPEMAGLAVEIPNVLRHPKIVRRSSSDSSVRLFYDFYTETFMGGKWLCVVVKYVNDDAFIVTAYLTNQPKPGDDLWPIK